MLLSQPEKRQEANIAPLLDSTFTPAQQVTEQSPWLLKCVSGPYRGRSIHIGNVEVIGSAKDQEVVSFSVQGEGVDLLHARITRQEDTDQYTIENLSDGFGTWISLRYAFIMHAIITHRTDNWITCGVGEKLWLNGRLIEVEMTESGEPTFEGIENQQDLLMDRDQTKKRLNIKLRSEDVDAFVRISRSHILLPNDVIRIGSLRFEVHRFNHATASVQGIRPSMEDEEFCSDGLLIDNRNSHVSMFNIYDGHGGMEASKFLRRSFHNYFVMHARNASIPDALLRTFQDADEALLSHVKEKGYSMNVGSVVNSIVIDSCRNIFCANLGDCRSVLALESVEIINLSRDLNPSLPEEAQRIKRCGGFVSTGNRVNGRLAVSRAIGDFEYKTDLSRENMVSNIPEIRVHSSTGQEEFVIMGCDGLFDVMTSEEVATFVRDRASQFVSKRQEPDPNQICVDLITECVIKRGTSDNVTVVLIFLKQYLQ